jgi:uncharacterized membrane protein
MKPLDMTTAAILGFIVGMRSMNPPAVIADKLVESGANQGDPFLSMITPEVASMVKLAAVGEAVGDKLPFIPPRTDTLPLLGRIGIASILGALLSHSNERTNMAATAGVSAIIGAHIAYYLRKRFSERLGIPSVVLGAVEDAIVTVTASAIAQQITEQPISRAAAHSRATNGSRQPVAEY